MRSRNLLVLFLLLFACTIPGLLSAQGLKPVNNVYRVKTAADLKWLIAQKTNFENFTIRLEEDIDFGKKTPLTAGFKTFWGSFDGNGKTIRNFIISVPSDDYERRGSAFILVNEGSISDLTIEGCVSASIDLALLVGENNGTITNCTSRGTVEAMQNGGGLVYHNSSQGIIKGSRNYAEVKPAGRGAYPQNFAGIVVVNNGSISDCTNYGSITGATNVAGICAKAENDDGNLFKNCANYGEIKGNTNVAGIVAFTLVPNLIIDNCLNAGIVRATQENCAGILANNQGQQVRVIHCLNTGLVSGGTKFTGGIIGLDGKQSNRRNIYDDCGNSGIVEGSGSDIGGIVGFQTSSISRCWNIGDVRGKSGIGGISGGSNQNSYDVIAITFCYNAGTVQATETMAGGIISYQRNMVSINNCYNSGLVSAPSIAGGIAGLTAGEIHNAYNVGTIDGQNKVGGITGVSTMSMDYRYRSFMNFCYNAGPVAMVSESSQLGHISNYSKPVINYYLNGLNPGLKAVRVNSGIEAVDGFDEKPPIVYARVLSGALFAKQSSFSGMDFATVWVMGNDRPLLRIVGEGDAARYQAVLAQGAIDRLALNTLLSIQSEGAVLPAAETGATLKPVNGVFTVKTADELAYLMAQKTNYKGQVIQMAADIDFGKTRVFTSGFAKMAGTFDGGGFAIKNLTIKTDNSVWLDKFPQSVGFVGIIEKGGRVQNLRIESGSIEGGERTGAIAGHCSGTIANCSNKASVSGFNEAIVGGIVGVVDSLHNIKYPDLTFIPDSLIGCTNSGSIVGYKTSGIAGFSRTAYIIDCSNTGKIVGNFAAGIVQGPLAVASCTNSGSVGNTDTESAAGIVCQSRDDNHVNAGVMIANCHNSGVVVANISAAGIADEVESLIINCSNSGAITSFEKQRGRRDFQDASSVTSAGILCYSDANTMMINCYNVGTISANAGVAGGLIGVDMGTLGIENESPNEYNFLYHCYALGEVSSKTGLAGILIGEKYKMASFIESNDTTRKLQSIINAEGVYYLKSPSRNAKIPPINFANYQRIKVPSPGISTFGDAGLTKLPADWDAGIWTIQTATKTDIARPILDLKKPVQSAVTLLPVANPEPAKYQLTDNTLKYATVVFDKGTTSNGWRYIDMLPAVWDIWETPFNWAGGKWIQAGSEELNMIWQNFFLTGRMALPLGLYFIDQAIDETHVQVMDFSSGRMLIMPAYFKGYKLGLRKL